ncbi:anti-anti-sigma factor [Catenulispora sp. GP43]|uniref:STAS domain-containing protein n=1 Tax=Catenulispora sp. GP43 TaxID=3156263 RepID=UPI003512AAF8
MTTTLTTKCPSLALPAPRRAFIPGPRRQAETIGLPRFRPEKGELLHVRITKRDGYTVVSLTGELDLTTSEAALPTLVSLLCEAGPRLIFDMGAVTFADSWGLSSLWQISDLATRHGGWARLAGVRAQQLLIIGLLSHTFPEPLSIYETVSAAAVGSQLPE